MGQHVLSLEEQRYGQTRSPWEKVLAVDYIAGYLSHCVERRGLIPSPTNDDNVPEEFDATLDTAPLSNGCRTFSIAEAERIDGHGLDESDAGGSRRRGFAGGRGRRAGAAAQRELLQLVELHGARRP